MMNDEMREGIEEGLGERKRRPGGGGGSGGGGDVDVDERGVLVSSSEESVQPVVVGWMGCRSKIQISVIAAHCVVMMRVVVDVGADQAVVVVGAIGMGCRVGEARRETEDCEECCRVGGERRRDNV